MAEDNDQSDSENEVNDDVHSNLIAAVTQLEGKQRVKGTVRKEPSVQVSEFHLVKSGTGQKDGVRIDDLTKALGKGVKHNAIALKVNLSKRQKTLPKPLEKIEATRIDRSVRYGNVKQQLGKWNAVVHSNRLADQLTFPLNSENITLEKSSSFLKKFKPETPLELEMAKVLNEHEPTVEEEVDNDKLHEFPVTLEEMYARRQEMAKLRAQSSYQHAKACRQKKIKSKSYHRILRKEKVKQHLKDFEVLKNTDPEAALQQLELLDKSRAEERASLRHRSTGQWAKSKAVRAKYDPESRKILAQQLAISRDLTQKVRKNESSDEDDVNEPDDVTLEPSDNPWVGLGPVKSNDEVLSFMSGCRKFYEEKKKIQERGPANEKVVAVDREEEGEESVEEGEEDEAEMSKDKEVVEVIQTEDKVKKNRKKDTKIGANNVERSIETDPVGLVQIAVKTPSRKSLTWNLEKNTFHGEGTPIRKKSSVITSNGANAKKAKKKKVADDNSCSQTKPLTGILKKRCQWPRITVKAVATSGEWFVSPAVENEGEKRIRSRNRKRNVDNLDVDDLFEDIDLKFKSKLTKKMKQLKSNMSIKEGNFSVTEQTETDDLGQSLAFKKQTQRPVIDEELAEGAGRLPTSETNGHVQPKASNLPDVVQSDQLQTGSDIDPNKFMKIQPKHLKTQLPDVITPGDEAMDDDEERQMTITEAFAEDDVVDQFRKEKEAVVQDSVPAEVCLDLPGWGQWGGKDIAVRPRRNRRFIPRPQVLPPRRDALMGDVIVNEEQNTNLRAHMVKSLPFPFTSVSAFEASIRAPIGQLWVPETSFRELTAPHVITKLGTIIAPMSEDALVKKRSFTIK